MTALREADLARVRRTEQLELAGEIAGLGHWETDLATDRLAWSPGMHKIAGRDPAAGEPGLEARFEPVHPDDRARARATVEAARAAGRGFERRARILRSDGEVRHVLSRGRPRLGAGGEVAGFFGIMQDVTEQVAAEARLAGQARENELFRQTIEAIPDIVAAKDLESRFVFANAARGTSASRTRRRRSAGPTPTSSRPRPRPACAPRRRG